MALASGQRKGWRGERVRGPWVFGEVASRAQRRARGEEAHNIASGDRNWIATSTRNGRDGMRGVLRGGEDATSLNPLSLPQSHLTQFRKATISSSRADSIRPS